MRSLNLFCLFLIAGLYAVSLSAKEHPLILKSPNGKLEVTIYAGEQLSYRMKYGNQLLVDKSPIGLILEDEVLGEQVKLASATDRSLVKEHIISPHYRCASFDVAYNEYNLKFKGGYGVIFRAYDEGIAYRFYTSMKKALVIKDEKVEINFPMDLLHICPIQP